MKTRFISLCLCLLAASSIVAEPSPKPATFFIHAGRFKHTFTCAAGVEAGNIRDGVLHADLHRGGDRFILVSYSEDSHPSRPQGHCGSGIESYLVWLQIRGSVVVASKSAQYESCWHNIEGGVPTWAGQLCTVEYTRFVYDPDTKQSTLIDSTASFAQRHQTKAFRSSISRPSQLRSRNA